jgi:hypothetical protein
VQVRASLEGHRVACRFPRLQRRASVLPPMRGQAEEKSYYKEVDARSRAILETEDLQVLTGILTETEDGAVTQVTPSARELLAETDPEMKIGQMLKTCMAKPMDE